MDRDMSDTEIERREKKRKILLILGRIILVLYVVIWGFYILGILLTLLIFEGIVNLPHDLIFILTLVIHGFLGINGEIGTPSFYFIEVCTTVSVIIWFSIIGYYVVKVIRKALGHEKA
jgi:hypothetical protein